MVLLLGAAVLAGCASTANTAAPMALDEDTDSTWVYLAAKYDVDGDGRITRAEYVRASGHFQRLDRDEDGVIMAADFESGSGDMEAMMQGMRAQRIVAMYFQIEDPGSLTLAELEQAAAAYDDDGDARISEAEFNAYADSREVEVPGSRRARMMMEGVEAWSAMIVVIDTDADGHVSITEMVAFFNARDDGDLVWSLDRGGRGGGRGAAMSGPAEGEPAPDFALQPPDGGKTVLLSSFRRNLPVALIFGSYT
jgi:Ca2+-binding EF-hand superfamily protein